MSYRHKLSDELMLDFAPLTLTVQRFGLDNTKVTHFHYSPNELCILADWLYMRDGEDGDDVPTWEFSDVGAPWQVYHDGAFGFTISGLRETDLRHEFLPIGPREGSNIANALLRAMPLTPDDYQDFTKLTDLYPTVDAPLPMMYTLGLVGEAGETADKIKKAYRDHEGKVDAEELKGELGDVLWYIARLGDSYGICLSEIMQYNLDKLQDRAQRGVIHGSGDFR